MSRAINVSAAEPRYFQWPFYQRQAQAQWPFDQGRNNGLPDRPLEFSNKLQFRYYPAQSIYQRSGQAIFNKSRPNDRCISARSNGRFYHRQAQWPFYQSRSNRTARPPDFRNKLQFRYYPAQSIYQRPGQAIFKQNPAQWPFYQRQVQWPFYQHQAQWPVLSRHKQPDGQTCRFEPQIAISLLSRTINLPAAGQPFSSKSRPMAVLSTPGPMAVLSTPGPMAVLSR